MSNYQKVIDKLQSNNLSWGDVDRIELQQETYEDFQDRASFDSASYATTDAPAIRVTNGQEKLVYVEDNGMQVTIEL